MDLKKFPLHPLTIIEIQNIIRMNPDLMEFILEIICLQKIKDGIYVIHLDEYADVGTNWIALYALNNNILYFDSFGV